MAIRLNGIFKDNMVFQWGAELRVFGSSDTKCTVRCELFKEEESVVTAEAVTEDDGSFLICADPIEEPGGPYEIRISAESGLRLFSLSIVFNVVNYIIKNASQSMKDMKLAYLICILNDLALPFIASMVLSYTIDLRYIWLCYCIGQATTMLVVMILLFARKRKMD